ncbi:NTP transferase domain-containing protein [Shewanella sp. Isolate13]|uniref:cytidylyltransferase domain-containing protein n=1 Tax=Shewanella sp. Isolate13 TaxID=2908531 RepID=UPI001EFEBAD3|nr:NTP transferase domain-containing protein [Shewanella sp. Isolate13]MCG9729225.1 NTP transferase domain-containing protein [Shewanella sp. Isolate13]
MNVIAIIGARLNSSRLPGKHLLPLAGKPIIEHIQNRLEHCQTLTDIVLATTLDEFNQPLINWANNNSQCLAYSGDVNDLMGRINAVVEQYQADIVVYICGDCPLIDPGFIDHAVNQLRQNPQADSISLAPDVRSIHEGMAFYTRQGWDNLFVNSVSDMEKEHVGYANQRCHCLTPLLIQDSDDFSGVEHRISVDTDADYRFMQQIYQRWYAQNSSAPIVPLKWVVDTLKQEVSLRQINGHVKQKKADQQYPSVSLYCAYRAADDALYQLSVKLGAALQEHYGLGTQLHVLTTDELQATRSQNCQTYGNEQAFLSALTHDAKQLTLCLLPMLLQQQVEQLKHVLSGNNSLAIELFDAKEHSTSSHSIAFKWLNNGATQATAQDVVIDELTLEQLAKLITSLL